ncbi:MAG TPA: hypothetical protein VGA00_01175 [Acidiferrobacterales bacterium]
MFRFIRQLIKLVRNPPDPNWHLERQARPSKTHPLGGFWKQDVRHDFGLAIGPAEGNAYYISFCGPGGCFEKGRYRPNSAIEGDPDYRVIDADTIEVKGRKGFARYVRVRSREHA